MITVDDFYYNSKNKIHSVQTFDGYSLTGAQINLLAQNIATFETDTGISWNDAVAEKNETAYSIISEMWVKTC